VRSQGMGVISMKLVGEGAFTTREDRQAAMKFAFNTAGVDAVTVGFKNTAEVDEAIENLPVYLGGPYVADDALLRRLHYRLQGSYICEQTD